MKLVTSCSQLSAVIVANYVSLKSVFILLHFQLQASKKFGFNTDMHGSSRKTEKVGYILQ